jgi:hypothetical protein
LISAVATLASAASASAGTLDQQQTTYGDLDVGLNGPDRLGAQTFTAGRTGRLDQVDLPIGWSNCQPTGDLIIQIQTLANDLPSGTALASASLAGSAISEETAATTPFVPILFPSPASVTAGTAYAIVLSAPEAGTCGMSDAFYEWQLNDGEDLYTAGASYFDGDGGASWSPFGSDAGFRTYVMPPAPPDTNPPETTITKGVKRSETGKAKFRFTSDEAGSFQCKLKGHDLKKKLRQFRDCDSPREYRNLDDGRFKFVVRAIDAAGNVDPTPDKDRFKVVD